MEHCLFTQIEIQNENSSKTWVNQFQYWIPISVNEKYFIRNDFDLLYRYDKHCLFTQIEIQQKIDLINFYEFWFWISVCVNEQYLSSVFEKSSQ